MKIKVCVNIDNVTGNAIKVVLEVLCPEGIMEVVDDPKIADLVIIDDRYALNKVYNEHQNFALFNMREQTGLPNNVRHFNLNPGDKNIVVALSIWIQELAKRVEMGEKLPVVNKPIIQEFVLGSPLGPRQSSNHQFKILVVDDKPENLEKALADLGDLHQVTLADSYNQGLILIQNNSYDVVLTDCQMPPNLGVGSALSIDHIQIGQVVPIGLLLIFHATARGSKVAMVTDANHHQDWVSAELDHLRGPIIINGQKVLLINYLGKDWKTALEKLVGE